MDYVLTGDPHQIQDWLHRVARETRGDTEESREGVTALKKKRKPEFRKHFE